MRWPLLLCELEDERAREVVGSWREVRVRRVRREDVGGGKHGQTRTVARQAALGPELELSSTLSPATTVAQIGVTWTRLEAWIVYVRDNEDEQVARRE